MILIKENKYSANITKTGLIYILGGILFLLSGILRGELISTLCGSLLLMFIIFSFFITLLSFYYWKHILYSLKWESTRSLSIRLITEHPIILNVLFYISETSYIIDYSISQKNSGFKIYTIEILLCKIYNLFRIVEPSRGTYYAFRKRIKINDFCHMFYFNILKDEEDELDPIIVFPTPEKAFFYFPQLNIIKNSSSKSTFKRNEEFFEIRSYNPGDDPRKINWKVFAHTGELSIRTGDLIPPPTKEYFIFLNSYLPETITHFDIKVFDILVNRVAYIANQLLHENKAVTFIYCDLYGNLQKTLFDPLNEKVNSLLLHLFSLPHITNKKTDLSTLAYTNNDILFFFSLPQSINLFYIIKKLFKESIIFIGPLMDTKKVNSRFSFLFINNINILRYKKFQATIDLNYVKLQEGLINVYKI